MARPWHQRNQTIPRRVVLRAQLAEATTSCLPMSTKDLQKGTFCVANPLRDG